MRAVLCDCPLIRRPFFRATDSTERGGKEGLSGRLRGTGRRPARVERLRRERERHKRQGDLESWEAIRVRQELFLERKGKGRRGDQEQFMRMIDRLREQEEARDFERSERWVQFLEGDR